MFLFMEQNFVFSNIDKFMFYASNYGLEFLVKQHGQNTFCVKCGASQSPSVSYEKYSYSN